MFAIEVPCPNPECTEILSVPIDSIEVTCSSCNVLITINEGDNSDGKELSEELNLLSGEVSKLGSKLSIDKK